MNEAIFNALCSCLGLPPSSEQALSLIRQAYTEPENNPQPARTADVIYWSLSPESAEDPASYNETAASSGTHKPTVHRYLAYQLLIVCYGPRCEAYAHRIRSFLYLDGAGLPRQILRKAGIYPVPDPPAPQLLYEPEGSLWRHRADLTIPLRVRDDLVYDEMLYLDKIADDLQNAAVTLLTENPDRLPQTDDSTAQFINRFTAILSGYTGRGVLTDRNHKP